MAESVADKDVDLAVAQLALLARTQPGTAPYYLSLFRSDDEFVRVGALCAMLDQKLLPPDQFGPALAFAGLGAVRSRAFAFFKDNLRFDLAERVRDTAPVEADALERLMTAELRHDIEAAVKAAGQRFLETGLVDHLVEAGRLVERTGGWRAALPWFVRCALIVPRVPQHFAAVLRLLATANRWAAVRELARQHGTGPNRFACAMNMAGAELADGNPDLAIATIDAAFKSDPGFVQTQRNSATRGLKVLGEAFEAKGDYRRAYRAFEEMKRTGLDPTMDPAHAKADIQRLAALSISDLPPAKRSDVVLMLGFARSGTTLLEMALDGHADIEALEETPAWDTAMSYISSARRSGDAAGKSEQEFYLGVRSLYFSELAKYRVKQGANVIIDKNPLRTMHARILRKLLPDQDCIFCIRHPYDVVLSCMRNNFMSNPAMESFRSLAQGVSFYDTAMSEWFSEHTLDDRRVHYLHYRDLVTSFDATLMGVLSFLGKQWDTGVAEFAARSEQKAALTPSYQKIRQGLSIGVQSYWQNYRFVFETPAAAPLTKWAKFFGYETV